MQNCALAHNTPATEAVQQTVAVRNCEARSTAELPYCTALEVFYTPYRTRGFNVCRGALHALSLTLREPRQVSQRTSTAVTMDSTSFPDFGSNLPSTVMTAGDYVREASNAGTKTLLSLDIARDPRGVVVQCLAVVLVSCPGCSLSHPDSASLRGTAAGELDRASQCDLILPCINLAPCVLLCRS